jgi:hypothetical protein
MINGYNNIDTDAGIGTILSNFDSDYINHIIDDSLQIKFRPFDTNMPNIPDVLDRNFNAILDHAPDYIDQVKQVRRDTYVEIISKICNYYNLTFGEDFNNINDIELYGICRVMYDIFISGFTQHTIDFFVMYIIQNAQSIASYLNANKEETPKPQKENNVYGNENYIDPIFITIHANINTVVYNMAGYDIPLNILLGYFTDPNTAARLNSLLIDNGDIYKNHYASLILDNRSFAGILTNIKLSLQTRTMQGLVVSTEKQ